MAGVQNGERLKGRAVRLAVLALAASSGVAFAQPGGNGQPPVYYAPGTGQRASWNPAIPLSARAVQNGATLTHDYGMDFVAIGRRQANGSWSGLNNAGYAAGQVPNDGEAAGRGCVTEAYRIGRTEVPTAVWVDFYNAASYVGATQGLFRSSSCPAGGARSARPVTRAPVSAGRCTTLAARTGA